MTTSTFRARTVCLSLILWLPLALSAQAPETPPQAEENPVVGQETTAAVESEPPVPDLSEVNRLIRETRYEEAERRLAELQESWPEDSTLLFMRGELLLALQKPEAALELLRRTAELDPQKERLHFQIGSALVATGQSAEAIEAFGRALESGDGDDVKVLAHLNRSMLFERGREWGSAAAEIEAVLALQPERVEAFGDLAMLQLQAGDLDACADALRRGEEAGFLSGQHYYSLGAQFYRKQRYDEAVSFLKQALEIDPRIPGAERSLAAALEKLGREDEAVAHLRLYLELAPQAPDREKVLQRIEAHESGGS